MSKVSLDRQISEVRRQLNERELEYRRKVAKREMRESEATYRLEALMAAIATLEWLYANRTAVLAAKAAEMAAVQTEATA